MGVHQKKQSGHYQQDAEATTGGLEAALTNKRLAAELESAIQQSWEWVSNKRRTPTPPEPRNQGGASGPCLLARRKLYKGLNVFTDRNAVLPSPTGQLEDFYELGEELGRGHFGVVRICVERSSGELWACKSLSKNRIKCWEEKDEVRREVAIMQHLSGHANVVGLKAAYEDRTHVHLIMELCQGGELFDLINERGSFDESEAAEIFRELTEVVAFCHSKGVMHRDLKPENILLVEKPRQAGGRETSFGAARGSHDRWSGGSRRPKIKLADFGLALFVEPGQRVQGLAGSPLYLAPEILKGAYGHSADVWSLGVILYILLAGTAPFCGETDLETIQQIEAGHLDFSGPAWRCVSEAAIDLIRWMLNLDAGRRPTAGEVLHHPWLAGRVSLPPASDASANESLPPAMCQSAMSPGKVKPTYYFGQAATPTRASPTSPLPSPTDLQASAQSAAPFPFVFSSAPSPSSLAKEMQSSMIARKLAQIDKLAQSLLAIQFLTPVSSPKGSALALRLPFPGSNPLLVAQSALSPTGQSLLASEDPFCPTALETGAPAGELADLFSAARALETTLGFGKGALGEAAGLGLGLETGLVEGLAEAGSTVVRSPRGPLEFRSGKAVWCH